MGSHSSYAFYCIHHTLSIYPPRHIIPSQCIFSIRLPLNGPCAPSLNFEHYLYTILFMLLLLLYFFSFLQFFMKFNFSTLFNRERLACPALWDLLGLVNDTRNESPFFIVPIRNEFFKTTNTFLILLNLRI